MTPREKANRQLADAYLAQHKAEEAAEVAERTRRLAAQLAREASERQEAERRHKRAQWALNESLVDSTFDSNGASEHEKAAVMNRLAERQAALTPESVWLVLQQLRTK